MSLFKDFYRGKRVLVTGHTGFKGAWLSFWLKQLGADVHGLAMPAPTNPSLHHAINSHTFTREDISDMRIHSVVHDVVQKLNPEVVFHLAAQSLVLKSYTEPVTTFEVNTMSLIHLLESIKSTNAKCSTVVVTSDKCYENLNIPYGYREGDRLGGFDPYSCSKTTCEMLVDCWRRSYHIPRMATARGGNVIGGGDYAPNRIVPDCIRALNEGTKIKVRNPQHVRPWQHVLDCLSGYLWLGARLHEEPRLESPFNFGPDAYSVRPVQDLVQRICEIWPGEWTSAEEKGAYRHESNTLTLSIDKAAHMLQWRPVWDFNRAVGETVSWYYTRHRIDGNMPQATLLQIEEYVECAKEKGLEWTK